MRTPDGLIPPLTEADEFYVTEIESRVEEALAILLDRQSTTASEYPFEVAFSQVCT
jgi:hypothetical protein